MKLFLCGLMASALAVSLTPASTPDAAVADVGARPPAAVVSCGWLQSHRAASGLVVVDIRTATEYAEGHIEGAVNVPFEVPLSAWITVRDDLLLELPDTADLFGSLGRAGITSDSTVVIVSSVGQPPYPQAGATRVAETLIYAGTQRVAILDGGFPKWVAEGRPTTTAVPEIVARTYRGRVAAGALVGTDYVYAHLGTALIVDARDPAVYSGDVVESWADKPGHIPSAVSLPAPSIWNADGTYRSVAELGDLVRRALGTPDRHLEIIVYCGVGGYASAWLYVMTRMLGYRNVRFYDGSAQEWVRYHDMEV